MIRIILTTYILPLLPLIIPVALIGVGQLTARYGLARADAERKAELRQAGATER